MKPSFWGPHAWRFLHAATFAYPETSPSPAHKQAFLELLTALPLILPCVECGSHFAVEIKAHPPALENRDALTRWLVDLHNRVNQRLGKPVVAYEDVVEEYTDCEKQCGMEVVDATSKAGVATHAATATHTVTATNRATAIIGAVAAVVAVAILIVFFMKRKRA